MKRLSAANQEESRHVTTLMQRLTVACSLKGSVVRSSGAAICVCMVQGEEHHGDAQSPTERHALLEPQQHRRRWRQDQPPRERDPPTAATACS